MLMGNDKAEQSTTAQQVHSDAKRSPRVEKKKKRGPGFKKQKQHSLLPIGPLLL